MIRTRRLIWIGVVLVVIGVLPLVSAWLASTIASAAGCTLNEAGANPCMIWGLDWGEVLVNMFVAGWFMLVTIPLAMAGVVLLVIGIGQLARTRRSG